MVFVIEDSPVYMIGAFDVMTAFLENQAKVQPAFKTGGGVSGRSRRAACSVRWRGFSARLPQQLVSNWLPALDGVVQKSWSVAPRWPISVAAMAGRPC